MIFQAGVQTGIAEGATTIVSVILQAVGGILAGLVNGYVAYIQSNNVSKIASVATFGLLAVILTAWHNDRVKKGKTAWHVEILAMTSRIFLTFGFVGIFLPADLAVGMFYLVFAVVILANLGFKRMVSGWFKSEEQKAEIFGEVSPGDISSRGASAAATKTGKLISKAGGAVGSFVKKNYNKIKQNINEKNERERINVLAAAMDSAEEGTKYTNEGERLWAEKQHLLVKMKNFGNYGNILLSPREKPALRNLQLKKVNDLLNTFQKQRNILKNDLELERLIGFAELTDRKQQEKFIKSLPKNSKLYQELRKEIIEEKKIINFLKDLSSKIKELSSVLGTSNDNYEADSAVLLNHLITLKENIPKGKPWAQPSDQQERIFNNIRKEQKLWLEIKQLFEKQYHLLEEELKGYKKVLNEIGLKPATAGSF